MFGIRTPAKKPEVVKQLKRTPPAPVKSVRRSIEWEDSTAAPAASSPEIKIQAGPAKPTSKAPLTQPDMMPTSHRTTDESSPPQKPVYVDKTAEARACLSRAKYHLNSSRNLKTEIKTAILEALDRLYQLVKEGEAENRKAAQIPPLTPMTHATTALEAGLLLDSQRTLSTQIAEHAKLLRESNRKLESLSEVMTKRQDKMEGETPTPTYASVAAINGQTSPQMPSRTTLHSIVVTSTDDQETGEEVLNRVRRAVDAKEGWVKVEKVRKAKDQKVIMGFKNTQERDKVKERLRKEEKQLKVEEVTNRDPLLILRGVLSANTDEDVTKALRMQNRDLFQDLDKADDRIVIRYRKRTRNPHACHVVISASPTIWQRAMKKGSLHVDLQRVKVEDQTPLVQCSRCLGFGHGRKYCPDTADICSHCGGQHLRPQCPEWLAETPPSCVNCTKAKLAKLDHNAFSDECPVRRKWDSIARSSVAYC